MAKYHEIQPSVRKVSYNKITKYVITARHTGTIQNQDQVFVAEHLKTIFLKI